MKQNYRTTPAGTRDLLMEKCARRRRLGETLRRVFAGRGYGEAVTPSLEFYDVFSACDNPLTQQAMYKLTDSENRILVLRPDCTIPIARLTASRLRGAALPVRLYYDQNVYLAAEGLDGKPAELTQSGVELIGAAGTRADVEIAATAVEALRACGLSSFKLEIGHVGLYKAIVERIEFEPEDAERVRLYIENKNYAALGDVLDRYRDRFPEACRALGLLPRLFGGEDVFGEAAAVIGNGEAQRQLDYLRGIYDGLCALGYGGDILVDLGLVHHIDYYTGLVFRGYVSGFGETALSGGRYDRLLASYGSDLPAVGFACSLDALADTLDRERGLLPAERPDVLIHYEVPDAPRAYAYIQNAVAEGRICELSVFDSLQRSRDCAGAKGIAQLAIFAGGRTEIETLKGGGDA